MTLMRPADQESHDYFKLYINQVSGDDFVQTLKESLASTLELLKNLEDSKWDFKYAEGKWSIKEVMIHVMDTERIFAYRALRISRNDMTSLSGFEQNDYAPYYDVDNRSIKSILKEFKAVRKASIAMFKNFNDEMLARIGTASDHAVSARALGFMIAGHEIHHIKIIKERYLDYLEIENN
ncbi:MAG: putative damage-inducible protein DinB [Saprospiraceae bacterium]|jgi:uncharacterized damage-inducible protein DinB